MSRVIDEHRLYLSDAQRVAAFETALAEVVRPADVVLDLGSGTGILGLLACRAGAARVYAIDGGGMSEPARAIAHANGLSNRLHVLDGFSTQLTLPERATLLVTDQIGNFGFDAGIVQYAADARRRLLAPDARTVPSRIDLLVAPVELPAVADATGFWTRRPAGFDMEPLHEPALNTGYPRALEASDVLGDATLGGSITVGVAHRTIAVEGETVIARHGTLHGVAGWFSAVLSPGVTMTNSPLAPGRITRRSIVFPVATATTVMPGDRVQITMRIMPDDSIVSWIVEVRRAGKSHAEARFAHSTLRGMLLAPDRVRRTRPDFRPRLTERGLARQSVLVLCDGRRALAEIEREVYVRHATLFRDLGEAQMFVAEVVAGDSE